MLRKENSNYQACFCFLKDLFNGFLGFIGAFWVICLVIFGLTKLDLLGMIYLFLWGFLSKSKQATCNAAGQTFGYLERRSGMVL